MPYEFHMKWIAVLEVFCGIGMPFMYVLQKCIYTLYEIQINVILTTCPQTLYVWWFGNGQFWKKTILVIMNWKLPNDIIRVCHLQLDLSYPLHVFAVNIDSHLEAWGCHNSEYRTKTYSAKSCWPGMYVSIVISCWYFALSTAVPQLYCAKFQNDLTTEMVMDERDMNFRWVSEGCPILQATAPASWEA